MRSQVPATALPGQSQSSHDKLAKSLGYFSIALGLAELLAPRTVCRTAGIEGQESLIRAYGAREIATGVAILMSHDATPWIWGRVAGDTADIATVVATAQHGNRRSNAALTFLTLIGVTAVDVFCATALTKEKGGAKTATADYSDRSGLPKGLKASLGIARKTVSPTAK